MKTLRAPRAEEHRVELRCRQPLDMEDVRPLGREARHPERVLGDLQRQPQPGASEHPRRQRIEGLPAHVSVGCGDIAEAKRGCDELDRDAQPRQRARKLVVVLRREGGRVGEDDAHGVVQ